MIFLRGHPRLVTFISCAAPSCWHIASIGRRVKRYPACWSNGRSPFVCLPASRPSSNRTEEPAARR
ncbi:hypothetical protein BofuT4_uP001270.1 [Botrytis cinerea T4]|uniref:Uncharacterized protein n=1 Tax=Botryotinia fuckeliana (strain T4) TaxID=999810 RepID=G2YM32_BOTF4|nr:hypothetical protein BofuT4_uP001270.1 [Botrytis cinerea T4]